MYNNKVFGYIRVSDAKQVDGASLSEQKRAILEYAHKNRLSIDRWFEETKTAAKTGRPKFDEMMGLLKRKKVQGVIMHKIDRSARNLHDWASVGDLIDRGIQVHFAHESLDMTERGGRLSADIQAVMASDYVRNLRQETLKGLYGRLNEGIYPFGAPVGYKNHGKGELKTLHPEYAPLVKKLFTEYSKGEQTTETMTQKMRELGLRNNRGSLITKNGISKILRNPFYTGLIKIKGQLFKGKHIPLIDDKTFKRVQLILDNRSTSFGLRHNYLFRRKVTCLHCGHILSGEKQKGMVYYRCQTRGCKTKTIREDWMERYFRNQLQLISLHKSEIKDLREIIHEERGNIIELNQKGLQTIALAIKNLEMKRERLLDAYLEGVVPKEGYQQSQNKLVNEMNVFEQRKRTMEDDKNDMIGDLEKILELCTDPIKSYDSAIPEEKREMVDLMVSNFVADQKSVEIITASPYREFLFRYDLFSSAPKRNPHRKPYHRIIYADKNTSSIILPPLKREELQKMFKEYLDNPKPLQELNGYGKYAL